MRQWVVGFAAAAILAAPRPVSAQARGWIPPDCKLSTGHYLVNSAQLYLKNAAETRHRDQRERDLRDARRVLLQAAGQGQAENGAVWYFLGRYYGETRDIPGLYSAFDRAERLLPDCRPDIRLHRRLVWVPMLNAGVDRFRAGEADAAIAAFQRANDVYDAEPPGFFYLGQLYATKQQQDSAVTYFTRAIEIASDSANRANEQYRGLQADAMFNIASLYHMSQKPDSAIVWYRRFREARPGDPQGMTRLADALEQAGKTDEAVTLYDSVLARADSMPTLELFQAGVAMFEAKRYQRAAQAFEMGLQRNPYYRDALFNLANTYLSLANASDTGRGTAVTPLKKELGQKMLPVATRLTELDPMSGPSRRLRAAAFQLQDLQDSTLAELEAIQAMPYEVTVSRFVPAGNGYEVKGIITNLQESAVTVPPVVFEFLNESGEVVQAITVESKQVEAGGVVPFALTPVGEGIAAWRYKPQS
ncbi:MAG TPA: tetratricopeptide repeat protein [Gemmatimonadales bacterium]|nr:tetratricopeptide repeat protein [Gemmatimonadales bacterium]